MESRLFGTISEEAERQGIVFKSYPTMNIVFSLYNLIFCLFLAGVFALGITYFTDRAPTRKSDFKDDKLVEILIKEKILLESTPKQSNQVYFNQFFKDENHLREYLAGLDVKEESVLSVWRQTRVRSFGRKILSLPFIIILGFVSFFFFKFAYSYKHITVTENGIKVSWLVTFPKKILNWTDIEKAELEIAKASVCIMFRLNKRLFVCKKIRCWMNGDATSYPKAGIPIRDGNDLVEYINNQIGLRESDSNSNRLKWFSVSKPRTKEFEPLTTEEEQLGIIFKSDASNTSLTLFIFTIFGFIFFMLDMILLFVTIFSWKEDHFIPLLIMGIVIFFMCLFMFSEIRTKRNIIVTEEGIKIIKPFFSYEKFYKWTEIEKVEFPIKPKEQKYFSSGILIFPKKGNYISCIPSGYVASSPKEGIVIKRVYDLVDYMNKKLH